MKKPDNPKLSVDIGIVAKGQLQDIARNNNETMTEAVKRLIGNEFEKIQK